jgi:hypothetical protein
MNGPIQNDILAGERCSVPDCNRPASEIRPVSDMTPNQSSESSRAGSLHFCPEHAQEFDENPEVFWTKYFPQR